MKRRAKAKKAKTPAKVMQIDEPLRDGEGQPADTVAVPGIVCKNCKSPNRSAFVRRERVLDLDAVTWNGVLKCHYNRVIWRHCECKDCGKRMIVKEFTMRPERPGKHPKDRT